MSKLVYLAGPITGLSYDGCTNWRDYTVKKLKENNIVGLSPMRCKEYLSSEQNIGNSYEDKVMSCGKGIITRDRWDCQRCDAVVVNLLGAKTVSIGTMMELGWSDPKPLILIMEKEGNPHEHTMVRERAGFIVETLEEAINVVKALFANE